MRIKVPTSKKKIAGYMATIFFVISACRVLTLFLETYATVLEERNQDTELLELCKNGEARGSIKMRAACVAARKDRASPIVLKAFLKSLSVSWYGFLEQVSTKSGFVLMILFLLSSFLPIVPMIQRLVSLLQTTHFEEDDEVEDDVEGRHIVVLNGGPKVETRGMRRRLRRMITSSRVAEVATLPGDDDYEEVKF